MFLFNAYNRIPYGKLIIGGICVFFMTLLPAFQYGVGTDYFSYQNIYNNANELDTFYQNKDYLFYGYMRLYQLTGWGFKGFIALTALLQSLLVFVIVFQLWKNYGYSLVLVFFLFWVVTNLFHTQMNIIRASFSIYLFAISILYKFRGKLLLSFILMVAALGFHRSALIGFCFLVIPDKMYFFACKHAFKIYVLTFLLFLFSYLQQIIYYIVQNLFPYYSHYLSSFDESSVSIMNVLTKMYWIPFNLLFLILLRLKVFVIKDNERKLIGMWALTVNVYLLMLSFDFISRVNYYFVIFYIIPIIYVIKYTVKNRYFVCLYLSLLYCFIPYLLKVILFPIAEFYYKSYLF